MLAHEDAIPQVIWVLFSKLEDFAYQSLCSTSMSFSEVAKVVRVTQKKAIFDLRGSHYCNPNVGQYEYDVGAIFVSSQAPARESV